MKVRGVEISEKIGESAKFRIYLGNTEDGQKVIVKVAKTFEDGNTLAVELGKFNLLRCFANQVSSYEERLGKTDSHYDWLFAELQSSFVEPTQGDRRISFFKVSDTELDSLIPLAKLYAGTEIDARSSIWILGRFFKFYGFFELIAFDLDSNAPQYPIFSPNDYLLGVEKHRLIYYNFSGDTFDVIANDFVKAIAKYIVDWVVIGEDPKEQEYLKLLQDFATEGRRTFEQAHSELYDLVYKLWEIGYHPFTYRERGTLVWKTIKGE